MVREWDTREFKILRIDMTIYRDRKVIDLIGGTGIRVTFNNTSTMDFFDFHFTHCNFVGFKGTALHFYIKANPSSYGIEIPIAISFELINPNELNKYTEEMCFALVLEHIPVDVMFNYLIGRIIKEASKAGENNIKSKFRSLIGCIGRED
jgi:hypothetical protein